MPYNLLMLDATIHLYRHNHTSRTTSFLGLLTISLIAVVVLCLVIWVTNNVYTVPTVKDPNLKVQRFATGLSTPTSMAFLGQNDILVLEKNKGTVQRIKDGVLLSQPLLDVNVATESEEGMLGIDVFKRSTNSYYVFLYYTAASSDGGNAIANRLYRYTFTNNPSAGPDSRSYDIANATF